MFIYFDYIQYINIFVSASSIYKNNMSDYRVIWLRDRISKALGVQEHPETIEELFREHWDKFEAFLDDEITEVDKMEMCILYIYRTFYDKLVEREVLTIEKGMWHTHNHKILLKYDFGTFFLNFTVVPRIMTPPQQVTIDVSKEKKGRRGKGKRLCVRKCKKTKKDKLIGSQLCEKMRVRLSTYNICMYVYRLLKCFRTISENLTLKKG